jgi:hypothetical protein
MLAVLEGSASTCTQNGLCLALCGFGWHFLWQVIRMRPLTDGPALVDGSVAEVPQSPQTEELHSYFKLFSSRCMPFRFNFEACMRTTRRTPPIFGGAVVGEYSWRSSSSDPTSYLPSRRGTQYRVGALFWTSLKARSPSSIRTTARETGILGPYMLWC